MGLNGALADVALSAGERRALDAVRGMGRTVDRVARRSGREFDIEIRGRYRDRRVSYAAWLPLLAISDLLVWTRPEIAGMTDHPAMAEAGDWSGVRDSSDAAVWAIFDRHAKARLLAGRGVDKEKKT